MDAQPMLINLQSTWDRRVEAQKIRSRVIDPLTNHKIEIGLVRRPGRNEVSFYAIDQTSCTEISKRVARRAIAGSGYIIQLNEYRRFRPKPEGTSCALECDPGVTPLPEHSIWARDPLFLVALANSKYFGFENLLPYNEQGAFIIVPCVIGPGGTVLPHWPQVLNRALVEDFLAFRRVTSNMVLFFNPAGGGASVEAHFHLQAVPYQGPLAIESAETQPFGKYQLLRGYSASGVVFKGAAEDHEIWACIERFQAAGVPVNVIAVGDAVYLMPRSTDREGYPTGAPASLEMCSYFVTADPEIYDTANRELLDDVLRRASLAAAKMHAVLKSDNS